MELDGTVLGAGELAGWLAEHAVGPLGVATVDTWALGTGSVAEIALAAAAGPAAWSTRPSWTRATNGRSPPGSPTRTGPRCSATPAPCGSSPSTAGASRASPWTRPSPPIWSEPGRRSFALDALSLEYLHRELAPAAAADGQLAFGADDDAEAEALMVQARAVLDLGEAFEGRLTEVGAADLLRDMELPTSILLARMERHGIAADRAHLESMEQMFAGAVQQAVKEAHAAAGHEFNLGSPRQLQEVLFGELGVPEGRRRRTHARGAVAGSGLRGRREYRPHPRTPCHRAAPCRRGPRPPHHRRSPAPGL
ncbi:DNA polymerase I [Streptomyces hirsutus]